MTKKVLATLVISWWAFILILIIGTGHLTKRQMPEMWHGKITMDLHGNLINTMDAKIEKRDFLMANLKSSIIITWIYGCCGIIMICKAYYKKN